MREKDTFYLIQYTQNLSYLIIDFSIERLLQIPPLFTPLIIYQKPKTNIEVFEVHI